MINKILANIMKTYIKKITQYDQIGFISEMLELFNRLEVINLANGFKDKKNHTIISMDVKNTFGKIQHIYEKNILEKVGVESTYSTQ